MRRVFVPAALVLALGLALAARFDPRLPYLFASDRLTWWVHPEPLSTEQVDEREGATSSRPDRAARFTFRPARLGRLDFAAVPRRSGDVRIGHEQVSSPAPMTMSVERGARGQAAIGLGGPAAPGSVTVTQDGATVAAVRAQSLLTPRPALRGATLVIARALLVAIALAFGLTLVFRPRTSPDTLVSPRRDLVPFIVGMHVLLAAWNLATYPVSRGLDAASHVEVAALTLAEHRSPTPERSFQAYHPPLHPLLGAAALGLTGQVRALQAISALAGVALVVLLGRGRRGRPPDKRRHVLGARGLALVAFLPVLLLTEPQATNEVLFALLMTATLLVAGGGAPTVRRGLAAGTLAGLSLLAKYTGLFALLGAVVALVAPAPDATPLRARLRAAATALAAALALGAWPYLERALAYGDPFVGNWDDVLGFRYRQPPGFRMSAYFTRFGDSLLAHPFRAREASLWDSLYVSTFGDGFGRFISSPLQHGALLLLAWLALPLALTALRGALAVVLARGWPSRLASGSAFAALTMVAALVRFNLELPYWSAAKGVFLLGLVLPGALAFERGLGEVERRLGATARRLVDADLALFALVAAATFVYRGGA